MITSKNEQLILGSLLYGHTNDIDHIKAEYFSNDYNIDIFKAIYKLYNKDKPVDMVTVSELVNNVDFDYFNDLMMAGVTGHQMAHINILVNAYKKRETHKLLTESVDIVSDSKNIDSFNSDIAQKLDTIILSDENSYNDDINAITDDALVDLKRTFDDEYGAYKTGIPFIDAYMVGLLPKELTVIGARSGVGKTALALQIAKRSAFNLNTLFISREMDKLQIFYRMLASELKIDGNKFKRRSFTKAEWDKIEKSIPILKSQMNININDKVSTITGIKKQLRKTKAKILYVDYIQLLNSESSYGNREREVAALSRELKNITLDFGIPVVALTQLNDNSHDERPRGERVMRESKAIYHDANNVIYIHEPTDKQIQNILENPRNKDKRRSIEEIIDSRKNRRTGDFEHKLKEVIIDKQRDGMKGARLFDYVGNILTFKEI